MTFNGSSMIVAAVILIVVGLVGGYLFFRGGGDNTKQVYLPGATIVQKDTIYSEKTVYHEKIIPVFTREIVELERADSPKLAVLEKEHDTIYVASIDTLFYDSLLHLNVKYNSQLPLDPKAYFSIEAKLNERTIVQKETIFVEKDVGIINRWLHFGIVAAAGYGLINQKSDIYIGLGVMIGL